MSFAPRVFVLLFVYLPLVLAKTVTYNWNLGWSWLAPDGFGRPVVTINNQFPLPIVNITKGDQVVINVVNKLGNESATIHFHGIFQNGSNAQDGPFQVTQCPIPTGGSLTYSFYVNQPGTYFYHSHYEGQYPDGLRGSFIVHDPESPFLGQYEEEIVLPLSDWYHDLMPDLTNWYLNATLNTLGYEPIPYSVLINDTQNVKLDVKPGTTYFLRIINYSAFSQIYLTFDQHEVTIIEIDGVYTVPRTVETLYIAVAQRYGVLLKTKSSTSTNYAGLAKLDQTGFNGYPDLSPLQNPNGNVYLVYNTNKPLPKPLNITLDAISEQIIDDFTLTPYDHQPLLRNPDQTVVIELDFFSQDGQNRAGFNNITWLPQLVPSMFTAITTGQAALKSETYGVNANAFVLGYNEVIEIVINNSDNGPHPLHIHGHAPQVVARNSTEPYVEPTAHQHNYRPLTSPPTGAQPPASALGYTGNESTMPAFPMRRDVWMVPGGGYLVLRFVANNPGVWFFHCHMDWHLIAGLAVTFVEAPLELQKQQSIPPAWTQACLAQGFPAAGNAAGNTHNYSDLTGANTTPEPLGLFSGPAPIN